MSNHVDPQDRDDSISAIGNIPGVEKSRLPLLDRYASLLCEEGRNQNLIARSTMGNLWSRHIFDSAQLIGLVPRGTPDAIWVDIGSGAGLPGLVCAILLPETQVILVEPRAKRAAFLNQVIAVLNLTNVEVRAVHIEQLHGVTADIISARAVASFPDLIQKSSHIARSDSLWLLPKGRSALTELQASGLSGAFHVERSQTDDDSGIIVGRLGTAPAKGHE